MAIRKIRLPSEYQQVEYIYKTGGVAYIDTGRKGNLNTKAEVKFKYDTLPSSTSIIVGARGTSSTTNAFVMGITSGHEYYARFGNGTPTENRQPYDTDIHIMTNSVDGGYLDSTKIATYQTQSSYETPYSVALFASRENDGSFTFNAMYCRIYYYKVWESGVLVQYLVPCYRKSDDVIGFYDIVSKTFLTNANSGGSFAKGNDVMPKVKKLIKNNSYVIRAYKGSSLYYNALPSAYQQVEYIESSGTQYINTGIAPSLSSDALKVVMKYATTTSTFTNTDNMLFGSGTPTNSDCCYFVDATRNKHLYVRYYNNNNSTTRSDFFTTYPSGVMVLDSNGLSVDGSTPITTSTSGSTSNDLPVYIFARNGTTTLNSSFKLYSFKMIKNGKLVRYFIPCYRISDTEIGLYDIVGGNFYTNSGTGTFTKGSDI